MSQPKKLLYLIIFFFLTISSIFMYVIYSNYSNESRILEKEKEVLKTVDEYHQLDLLLKEKRGLEQIRSPKINNWIKDLEQKIKYLSDKLKNETLKKEVLSTIHLDFSNKEELFYEYTKVINYLNIQKAVLFNTSKHTFSNKRVHQLLNTMFLYELPSMIENIGKIRGVGSGIFNLKKNKKIDTYVLKDNLNNFQLEYKRFVDNTKTYQDILNHKNVKLNLKKLEKAVEKIHQKRYELEPYEYFHLASEIIRDLNLSYNHAKQIIIEEIKKESLIVEEKIITFTFVYIFLIFIIVYFFGKSYRVSQFQKMRNRQKAYQRKIDHKLHDELHACSSLKILCDKALKSFSHEFLAFSSFMYMVDKKNHQLNLVSTYHIDSSLVSHILPFEGNTISQAIENEKIVYEKESIFVPIIFENIPLACIVFNFDKPYCKKPINMKLINLLSTYIYKVQQDEENKKYFDLIDNYVLTSSTNKEGLITYVSDALCKNTHYKKEELLGKSHSLLKDDTFDKTIYKELWHEILLGNTYKGEIRNIKKDGTRYWIDVIITPEYGFYGDIIGFNSIRYDISNKKRVEQLAIKDSLTNIYNRRYFDETFSLKIDEMKREKGYLVFAIFDIDFFKQYNDTYGHDQGDEALKNVANILQNNLKRTGDYLFRLGGEEFGMLFKCKQREQGISLIQNILNDKALKSIKHANSQVANYLTLSVGVYFIDRFNNLDEKEIYSLSDKNLYQVKRNGRNNYFSN